ncbi:DUF6036 family nucleotidyltransferase [Marinisporobacter balticus]|uniref:DUF6036 domain-containing protein n=1 Tax=Marinisporobacter balticus TaxID=2018667 RepID=A0A4R2K6X3_9FIRM|nr:DUF6036 family nucleotidyltransferase [Marinisporobacter balticus]TCO69053.1 hypothetical protein EV214_1354 [Marinisporobacter balticus]
MENKNREILFEILQDMEDFANMKNIEYPPIYLLGGSGCIVAGYLDRATTDVDFLDMDYQANIGRLFKILDRFDMLDIYLTTIPLDFIKRAIKIKEFQNIYVLSKEDIILSKIGRYSEKDIEDMEILIKDADKQLILELIGVVEKRNDIGEKVKNVFIKNVHLFKERFYV